MEYKQIYFNDLDVYCQIAVFKKQGFTTESHSVFIPGYKFHSFSSQLKNLGIACTELKKSMEFNSLELLFKRFFVSDASNQFHEIEALENHENGYAVSMVQQPMLNGAKISMWAYWAEGSKVIYNPDGFKVFENNGYQHIWATQMCNTAVTVEQQTSKVFESYNQKLQSYHCNIKDNCIRTWLFVQNVDVNYCGVVDARRNFFEHQHMTRETHYIASTGIEGRYSNPNVLLLADAYAIGNIKPEQIRYLKALDHLNHTYEYGVTFERGTSIDYGDRRHIYISGTASIDAEGQIIHPGNVLLQTHRTIENITALLQSAEASMDDVVHLIVYLRDIADYKTVAGYFESNYQNIPKVIVLAPVCRPGWLIEMECMAIKPISNEQFQNF